MLLIFHLSRLNHLKEAVKPLRSRQQMQDGRKQSTLKERKSISTNVASCIHTETCNGLQQCSPTGGPEAVNACIHQASRWLHLLATFCLRGFCPLCIDRGCATEKGVGEVEELKEKMDFEAFRTYKQEAIERSQDCLPFYLLQWTPSFVRLSPLPSARLNKSFDNSSASANRPKERHLKSHPNSPEEQFH